MAKQGLVGFFDILGYQNIIDNNDIEKVSEIISKIFLKLPDDVRREMVKPIQGEEESIKIVNESIKELESRLISDSILLVFPIPVNTEAYLKYFASRLFLRYVRLLLELTFKRGLPLRGTVDFGEFFLEDHCFAGKPIIDCYRVGQQLDFSGCVLTNHGEKAIRDLLTGDNELRYDLDRSGQDFLCPKNDGSFERYFLLSWGPKVEEIADPRQFVFNSFKEYNKDIGPGVERKITNTELMLRFFKKHALAEVAEEEKE